MKYVLWAIIALGAFHLPMTGYLLLSGYVPLGAASLALLNLFTTVALIPLAIKMSRKD